MDNLEPGPCPICGGTGGERYYAGHGDFIEKTCPTCDGTGEVLFERDD